MYIKKLYWSISYHDALLENFEIIDITLRYPSFEYFGEKPDSPENIAASNEMFK